MVQLDQLDQGARWRRTARCEQRVGTCMGGANLESSDSTFPGQADRWINGWMDGCALGRRERRGRPGVSKGDEEMVVVEASGGKSGRLSS